MKIRIIVMSQDNGWLIEKRDDEKDGLVVESRVVECGKPDPPADLLERLQRTLGEVS